MPLSRPPLRRKPSTTSPAAFAFAKVKAGKPRPKLRKQSLLPMRLLIKKADRALQDWYRRIHAGESCEACGEPFQVMHHFFEKSQSAGLRFDDDNLIFLCHSCHFRHHRTGDQGVTSTVILSRGEKWHKDLLQKRLETKTRGSFSRTELETFITTYTHD